MEYLLRRKFHIYAVEVQSFILLGNELKIDVMLLIDDEEIVEKLIFKGVEYFEFNEHEEKIEHPEILDFIHDSLSTEDHEYLKQNIDSRHETKIGERIMIITDNYSLFFVAESISRRVD